MTTLKTAEQAYNASVEAAGASEREEVAKLIDKACSQNKFSCFAKVSEDTAKYLRNLGYSVDEQTNFGKVTGYEVSWAVLPPAFVEIATLEDAKAALESAEPEVYIELKEDMAIAGNDYVTIPAGKTATIKVDGTITSEVVGFVVGDGGKLVLTGEGTIATTNTKSNSIIQANGANASVVIDGVTVKTLNENSQAYGVYLLNDASVTMKSGSIKTAYAACISTNNTTGGATNITIKGGELSSKVQAMYLPSHCNVTISGGKVSGICARMGNITIKGDGEVTPVPLTDADADPIGKYFDYSGFAWIGDTINILAGTYTDAAGTDCKVTVAGNGKVTSNYRAAIGVYAIDTKQEQNVTVNISKPANVTTTDTDFDAVTVYDHEYLATEAAKYNKTYSPVADSVIKINGI